MIRRIAFLLLVLGITTSCSTLENFMPSRYPEGQPIYVGSSPCALPCLYGITPGQTPFSQALDFIASLPPNQQTDDNASFWMSGLDESRVHVTAKRYFPGSDVVSAIELATYDYGSTMPIVTLGQFIDSGWEPTHVYRIRATGPDTVILLLVFGERGQIIAEVVGTSSINADSPIDYLLLVSAQDSQWLLDVVRNQRLFDHEIAWLGYASADDYYADPILP